jgi:hypothetical protein
VVDLSVGTGSISSTGLYTAPSSITTLQTVTVTANECADFVGVSIGDCDIDAGIVHLQWVQLPARILIDHTKIPNTDQVNFPFLFSVTDPNLKAISSGGHITNSNGYDIIFSSDPNGTAKLNYELESYNPTTGQLIAWIRIPSLSHSTDTPVYLFYGNSSITTSQANPTGVWDANYQGVWHFANGSVLSVADSSINLNNGVNNGAAATSGQIDGAAAFNGTTSYVGVGTNITTGQMNTVSMWAYINSLSSDQELVSHSGLGSGVEVSVFSGAICGYVMGSAQSNVCSSSGAQIPGWNHIVLTQGGPSAPISLYINGVSVGTSTAPASIANPSNLDFGVWANASGRYFHGTLDEVRL